jgi:hypothetical protein
MLYGWKTSTFRKKKNFFHFSGIEKNLEIWIFRNLLFFSRMFSFFFNFSRFYFLFLKFTRFLYSFLLIFSVFFLFFSEFFSFFLKKKIKIFLIKKMPRVQYKKIKNKIIIQSACHVIRKRWRGTPHQHLACARFDQGGFRRNLQITGAEF